MAVSQGVCYEVQLHGESADLGAQVVALRTGVLNHAFHAALQHDAYERRFFASRGQRGLDIKILGDLLNCLYSFESFQSHTSSIFESCLLLFLGCWDVLVAAPNPFPL